MIDNAQDKNIKYVLCPGHVNSAIGEKNINHFVTADRLIELYGVDESVCFVLESPIGLSPFDYELWAEKSKQLPVDAIYLRPREDGNYQLEESPCS